MKRSPALVLLALALASPGAAQQAASDVPLAGAEGVPVPKRTKSVLPEYPAAAQAQGVRGIVILQVLIDEQGKVSEVDVVRSIPGLDEAAITAVRQWEYEPVKIDGRATPVRLTVPITFLMKLPEVAREVGVPELRQGAMPANPRPEGRATVTAQLTVDPDGQLVEAEIVKGESPFSEALLQALRTWAFVADVQRGMIAFRLQAEFQPAERGRSAVTLTAGGVRHDLPERAAAAPPAGAPTPSAPQAETPAPPIATPAAPPAPAPPPSAAPQSETPAPVAPASAAPAATAPDAAAPGAPPPAGPAAPAPIAPTAAPGPAAPASPQPQGDAAAARTDAAPAAAAVKPPVTEVLRAPAGAQPGAPASPGAPPEGPQSTAQHVSAVRDVVLGQGVPELGGGRRPVVPPLARLGGVNGVVSVRFSIDSGGATQVASVEGPQALERAARQMVESWSFRRLRPERLMAVAQVRYEADQASAVVSLEP
ncbi:MAG: TonB family protein [Vicinamibacteria bacterium]